MKTRERGSKKRAAVGCVLAFAMVLFAAGHAVADAAPAATAPACRVVVLSGQPGSPVLARRFADWSARFRAYCIKRAAIPESAIVSLSGDASVQSTPATAESVLKAFADLGAKTAPADQIVVFIVGHGDTADGEATVAFPGRDLRVSELAAALARLPASHQIILHFGAASGDALAPLADKNRMLLTATSPGEPSDPVFAEFFLQALERAPADQPPTLLDAYNSAAHETALWIRRLHQTESGTWLAEGKQAIALFHKLCDGPEEAAGARTLDPASKPTDPDPEIPLVTPGDQESATKQGIPARIRVVSEHALLCDTGSETGVAAVSEKGFAPVRAGQAEGAGAQAARTILGRP